MRATRLGHIRLLCRGTLPFDLLPLHQKYGPVVRIGPNELAFSNPQAWKDIMGHRTDKSEEFEKYLGFYRPVDDLPVDIVNAKREEHGLLRRTMAHGFSDRSMREQQPLIKQYVDLLMRKLRAAGGKKVDLAAWYNYTTFDVIGDLAFGESFGCLEGGEYHPWVKAIFELARVGVVFQSLVHYPWVFKALMAVVPKSLMEERERQLQKLQANSAILIIGGSETTATLLSGVTFLLMTNLDALEKLTAEVRGAFKSEDEIDFMSVSNLPYLLACLDEALRMYPPVPTGLPRVVPPAGASIAEHYVPGGTVVAVHQWAMYHNEEHFKKPFEFHPERWLGDPEFASDHKEAFQPFHLGPRNCLGRNLAYIEMRLILARVLWNFDLKMDEDSADWMSKQRIFNLWEKGALNAYLTPVQR
ncbi:Putative cytochrome P450 E-class, group I [Podospora comata]|uniref:Cytochrome P450 E-class, group I n=1 Tax=Podospora comata TaxID=48703 RepID=A0ABY6SCI2_PODCO|nr:Putative cytochrome P450 E-class, group I [Podospora comata]